MFLYSQLQQVLLLCTVDEKQADEASDCRITLNSWQCLRDFIQFVTISLRTFDCVASEATLTPRS